LNKPNKNFTGAGKYNRVIKVIVIKANERDCAHDSDPLPAVLIQDDECAIRPESNVMGYQ
jgi:hypothetical protein